MSEFIGVTRERRYSPGKVRADRAILDEVALRLAARHRVRVVDPDECRPGDAGTGCVVFAMCESPEALAIMGQWEESGARLVNSPAAILGCRRHRTVGALQHSGVSQPPSVVVTTGSDPDLPSWADADVWVKRGEMHAMHAGDVRRVRGGAAIRAQLRRLRRRGIATALIQRHVPGRVIKFYAVGADFFACFPSGQTADACTAAEAAAIRAVAERGAAAVGLEVFGGDAVRGADGKWLLIDLNDWPSYAPCRRAAADAIAAYLSAPAQREEQR